MLACHKGRCFGIESHLDPLARQQLNVHEVFVIPGIRRRNFGEIWSIPTFESRPRDFAQPRIRDSGAFRFVFDQMVFEKITVKRIRWPVKGLIYNRFISAGFEDKEYGILR